MEKHAVMPATESVTMVVLELRILSVFSEVTAQTAAMNLKPLIMILARYGNLNGDTTIATPDLSPCGMSSSAKNIFHPWAVT